MGLVPVSIPSFLITKNRQEGKSEKNFLFEVKLTGENLEDVNVEVDDVRNSRT